MPTYDCTLDDAVSDEYVKHGLSPLQRVQNSRAQGVHFVCISACEFVRLLPFSCVRVVPTPLGTRVCFGRCVFWAVCNFMRLILLLLLLFM